MTIRTPPAGYCHPPPAAGERRRAGIIRALRAKAARPDTDPEARRRIEELAGKVAAVGRLIAAREAGRADAG